MCYIQTMEYYSALKGNGILIHAIIGMSLENTMLTQNVWMWELDYEESWALKNWCFWTVVLEKTLEGPLDCKEIQPVIIKEISPGCSLEGLMLRLKLQSFGHLMRRADSYEKTLMLGKIEGRNERLLLNHKRCRDSWPPEKNSIWDQRWGLISQSFCVIKFY